MLLGKYKYIKTLGKGGMGKVFLCQNEQNKQLVAIKEIYRHHNRENNLRFEREYNFLSSIDHPNIVKAYDFFTTCDQQQFIVMEYVDGIHLNDFIKENAKLSLKELLAIAIQITRAVEVINAAGIVHRDIKPENIMVDTKNHVVKILDLGMGKELFNFSEIDKLTKSGAVVGTLEYMSPEQVNGQVSENSDVFSIAVTIYQLLCWQTESPFAANGIVGTMNNLSKKKLQPLHTTIEVERSERSLYKQINSILQCALEKEHHKRTTNCEELASSLGQIYHQIRGKKKWKPTVQMDKKTQTTLCELQNKFPGEISQTRIQRYKQQRRKNKSIYAYVAVITVALLFLPILFVSHQKPLTFENIISTLSELESQKKYAEINKWISLLDKEDNFQFFTSYKPQSEIGEFLYLFYTKNWQQKTLDLGAKILRDNPKGLLGLFYNVRLFVCKGEMPLATWYSGIVNKYYPKFFTTVNHPALSITLYRYKDGHTKLRTWSLSKRLEIEKSCCQFFLDMILLKLYEKEQDVNVRANWDDYVLPGVLKVNTFFKNLYRFIEYDYRDYVLKNRHTRIIRVNELARKIKNFENIHHLVHRVSALQIKVEGDFTFLKERLQPFIEKYPSFLPTKVMVHEYLDKEHHDDEFLRDTGNTEELKGIIYECLLACQRQSDLSIARKYTNYLCRCIPDWHYSYLYKANLELPQTGVFTFLQGLRISHIMAGKYNMFPRAYTLPIEQKLHFLLELKWLISTLVYYQDAFGKGYYQFLQFLVAGTRTLEQTLPKNAQYQELIAFVKTYPEKYKLSYHKLLKYSGAIPKLYKYLIEHAIVSKQYDKALAMLENHELPLLKGIALLRTKSPTPQDLLDAKNLFVRYKDTGLANRYYCDYNLECYHLSSLFYQQKMYDEALVVYQLCGNWQYVKREQRSDFYDKITAHKKPNKSIRHSTYAHLYNRSLQNYISSKQFGKAATLLPYAKYLSTLQLLDRENKLMLEKHEKDIKEYYKK